MVKFDPTFKNRPLSHSQLSSFQYDPRQWYDTYILGNKQSSPEMTFGSFVDKKIQDDPLFIPELSRYSLMQHKMKVCFDGIHMVGLPDGLDLKKFLLADYKSGRVLWDKKRADETEQLTMYLFLIYITYKISPDVFKCFIHWLPTIKVETGDFNTIISFRDNPVIPITFETKRTMKDLLSFGSKIKKIVKEMELYAEAVQKM